jgi:hypothetical protein
MASRGRPFSKEKGIAICGIRRFGGVCSKKRARGISVVKKYLTTAAEGARVLEE